LELVVLDMPLADVYADHWSVTGRDILARHAGRSGLSAGAQSAAADQEPPVVRAADINECDRLAGIESVRRRHRRILRTFAGLLDASSGGSVRFTRPFAQLDKAAVMRLASACRWSDDVVP